MACHFTGMYDNNRNTTLPGDDFSLVQAWAASMAAWGVNALIFHNNFSRETVYRHQHAGLQFVQVGHNDNFSPNVYRYCIYQQFLQLHLTKIASLFVTDVTDVVLVSNPFVHTLFLNNPAAIFCGDEPAILDNVWMKDHAEHLRKGITGYAAYEESYKAAPLLNCGIIGGTAVLMKNFIDELSSIHRQYNYNNPTAYTGDMGAFNYLIRTRYNDRVLHGEPVNTIFKGYENERADCWFRHK
jgi:hypothetical protein